VDDNEQSLLARVEQAAFTFENVSDLPLVAHNDSDNVGLRCHVCREVSRVRSSANYFVYHFRTRIEHRW
jgi:hypothetical protein